MTEVNNSITRINETKYRMFIIIFWRVLKACGDQ